MGFIDLTGQRYERLTVIKRIYMTNKTGVFWLCKCDCGQESIVRSDHLRYGKIKSCGCFLKEVSAPANGKKNKKHGDRNTRLYKCWMGMKQRCAGTSNDSAKKHYYDKGIKVCSEWKDDFIAFKTWAINNGYDDNLTLDRIDPNGDYTPKNCRWADKYQQANNKTNNRKYKYKNEFLTMAEIARKYGISYTLLQERLQRGWNIQQAISGKK